MPDSNGTDREFTRVEAAAFLTEIGHKISPQRLATRATEDLGPPFKKNGRGRNVVYKESELRAWAASPDAKAKGGRGKRAPRVAPPARSAQEVDLRAFLRDHLELADELASGTADVWTGYRFAQSIATLRKLVG